MRLRLVPEGHARQLITPTVGVAVLEGDADGFVKDHRVLDMKAVERHGLAPVLTASGDNAVVGRCVFLRRAPSGVPSSYFD